MSHTLSYLDQRTDSSTELRIEWKDERYVASVVTQGTAALTKDLIRTVGVPQQVLVAQKPAQRFRNDRFHAFAAEQLASFEQGEFDHLLEQDNE